MRLILVAIESEIWIPPVVASAAAIMAIAIITGMRLHRWQTGTRVRVDFGRRSGLPGVAQCGIPMFAAAIVFLVLARPQNPWVSWIPFVLATAAALIAWLSTRKSADTFAEIAYLRRALESQRS
ncbi:hypothetical protein [Nocardia pseudobrasiliensis]|uniref:Uncharacterized protein n=2 Tax=Nocardia pseudobrasiliensis TaxID=45979 RepID=A0A370IEB4_9NOCA|nr:hypothetical protein [Nocardia pseudobrasiliensis]RDI69058.1 hypothetical protein DFR76_101596 [Nocardia pseudobrasiliensis]